MRLAIYLSILPFFLLITEVKSQDESVPASVLKGSWLIDLTPNNQQDSSFASMDITAVTNETVQGYFYRPGVQIQEGRINASTGKLYAALESEDGAGKYYTAFYYDDDKLYGTTHSIDKDFLSVWVATRKTEVFQPSFEVSKKTTHEISKKQDYTFGYLEVLENRSNPDSRTIKIPVYIFKSRSANPKPDPIIYTVGGPGATTMPSAQYMNYYKYLDDRDFILVEQRGNYYAQPHLACPEWSNAIHEISLPGFDQNQSDRLLVEAAKACRERLTGNGIDLNGYHTNEIAADIADLVDVLGIENYNLLTISYSTKIAQVLLRDYPEGIRSVVMDSPLPLEVNYDEESVQNLLASVDKLLSDCETDEQCNQAFPNLKNRFHEYLVEITETPLQLTVNNPISQNAATFKLSGKDMITVFTSASTSEVSSIPFEINRILNGDLSTVKEQLQDLFQAPNGGAGIGMRLSVWCAEEYPFVDQSIVARETLIHPAVSGLSPAVFESSVCDVWGVSSLSVEENKQVQSEVPVLLISGEYDSETPPKWAEQMSENLSNSYHLVFRAWKHTPTTNWGNPCGMEAANDFFNKPDQTPNPKCFSEIGPPLFKVE